MATLRLSELPDTGTVTVASKLPTGLVLELPVNPEHEAARDKAYEDAVKNGRNPHPIRIAEAIFGRLRGVSTHFGASTLHISGGYALTPGIDAAKFKQWYIRMQKAGFGPVMDGLIFACAAESVARDKAAEQAEIKSGLEPIDPAKPGRGVMPDDGKEAA